MDSSFSASVALKPADTLLSGRRNVGLRWNIWDPCIYILYNLLPSVSDREALLPTESRSLPHSLGLYSINLIFSPFCSTAISSFLNMFKVFPWKLGGHTYAFKHNEQGVFVFLLYSPFQSGQSFKACIEINQTENIQNTRFQRRKSRFSDYDEAYSREWIIP